MPSSAVNAHILELLPVAVFQCDTTGRIVQYNSRAVELWGRHPVERDRFGALETFFLTDGTYVRRTDYPIAIALREGRSFRDFEAHGIRTDGQAIHMVVNVDPIRDESYTVVGAIQVVQDVTALRQKERIFETVFQQSAIGIALLTTDGTMRDVNPFFHRTLGYTKDEMMGRLYWDFLHPDELQEARESARKYYAGEISKHSVERRYIRKDGEVVTARINVAITDKFADFANAILTFEDISKEKRTRLALSRSEKLVRRLVDAKMIGLTLADDTGRIEYANDTFIAMLGYTREEVEKEPLNYFKLTPPEYHIVRQTAHKRMKSTGSCAPFESVHRRKDGTQFPALVGLAPMDEPGKNVAWVQDLSRQKELEARLLQTQKMEAVGMLAGGVAHDFNNSLMVIGAQAELLLASMPESKRTLKIASSIMAATERAGQLTRKLLGLGRKQELAITVFDINELLTETADVLRHLLPKRIDFQIHSCSAPCWVKADRAQMEQVIINLILNSRDSMPDGGRLVLRADGVVVEEDDLGIHGVVPVGEYALVSVADTGHGIPQHLLNRIFEPFFTTKSKEKGTGLGLALVYGIVDQIGGHIRVKSNVNAGTTFSVYLPATETPVIQQPQVADCPLKSTNAAPCVAPGTVLVVDDEELVRASVRAFLEHAGLTVVDTGDPKEAVRIGRELGDRLFMLVSDVVMPGVTGPELARTLLTIRPGLRVLFMSGYAAVGNGHEEFRSAKFLQKPFTRTTLIEAVCACSRCQRKTMAGSIQTGSNPVGNRPAPDL